MSLRKILRVRKANKIRGTTDYSKHDKKTLILPGQTTVRKDKRLIQFGKMKKLLLVKTKSVVYRDGVMMMSPFQSLVIFAREPPRPSLTSKLPCQSGDILALSLPLLSEAI